MEDGGSDVTSGDLVFLKTGPPRPGHGVCYPRNLFGSRFLSFVLQPLTSVQDLKRFLILPRTSKEVPTEQVRPDPFLDPNPPWERQTPPGAYETERILRRGSDHLPSPLLFTEYPTPRWDSDREVHTQTLPLRTQVRSRAHSTVSVPGYRVTFHRDPVLGSKQTAGSRSTKVTVYES